MQDRVKIGRICFKIDSIKWYSVFVVYFSHLEKIQALVFGEAPYSGL